MPPNMPHSRMTPTPPLRPIHPWPGVARDLGARVKGHVLPDSPKSAPLTGGRFRRPAKTHGGTPSGAHFSHHLRVWRPVGGAGEAPGRRPRVREPPCVTGCGRAGPIRVRRRRPRDSLPPDGARVPSPRRRRRATRTPCRAPERNPSPMPPPWMWAGVGRHPIPCGYEVCWRALLAKRAKHANLAKRAKGDVAYR